MCLYLQNLLPCINLIAWVSVDLLGFESQSQNSLQQFTEAWIKQYDSELTTLSSGKHNLTLWKSPFHSKNKSVKISVLDFSVLI